MNNFSKLSLYDFLAVLIPGFVILWLFNFFNDFHSCPYIDILWAILSYITGLCYHKLIELLMNTLHLRRNEKMEKIAWEQFYKSMKEDKDIPEDIDNHYVKSYYRIAKNGCLMNIPVLEAQETFLRNMLPLIIITIIKLQSCPCSHNVCCISIFLAIIMLISIVIWYSIMLKIYKLVWEGDHYLTQNENDSSKIESENNNTQNN